MFRIIEKIVETFVTNVIFYRVWVYPQIGESCNCWFIVWWVFAAPEEEESSVENRLQHIANTTEPCRADDGPPCRFFLAESTTVIRAGSTLVALGVIRRRAGTSREPPSSSTSAVDKVTARHYWGAADQGDVEAGEEEEADEGVSRGDSQDGRQPEERWRVWRVWGEEDERVQWRQIWDEGARSKSGKMTSWWQCRWQWQNNGKSQTNVTGKNKNNFNGSKLKMSASLSGWVMISFKWPRNPMTMTFIFNVNVNKMSMSTSRSMTISVSMWKLWFAIVKFVSFNVNDDYNETPSLSLSSQRKYSSDGWISDWKRRPKHSKDPLGVFGAGEFLINWNMPLKFLRPALLNPIMESNVNNLSFEGSHPRLPWTWTSDVRRGSGPSDGCQGDQIQIQWW